MATPAVTAAVEGDLDENLARLVLLGHGRIRAENNEQARKLVAHMRANHRPLPATAEAIRAHRSKRFYRRSGDLQNSMKVVGSKTEGRQSRKVTDTMVRAGGREAPYAPFVELGTSRSRAFPFVQPALDAVQGKYFVEMGEAMNAQIRAEV